ncbi:MAG: DNA-directed DNA polymerase [Candidatus Micrarchaeia archaeon]
MLAGDDKQAGAGVATGATEIKGIIFDADYIIKNDAAHIRLAVKGDDGNTYEVLDSNFKPYFYLAPQAGVGEKEILAISAMDNNKPISATGIEKEKRQLFGKYSNVYKIYTKLPSGVPKLSSAMQQLGKCYEYDIPFAKRYLIDSGIMPLTYYRIVVSRRGGMLQVVSMEKLSEDKEVPLNVLCFDIEVYNPLVRTRPEHDPILMISYSYNSRGKRGKGVITYKGIGEEHVIVVKDEKSMLARFSELLNELDIDIVTGYNSANFDVKYMLERAKVLGVDFSMSRFEGDTHIESHGLLERVKISGRVHVDMYNVAKFIATVGATEKVLKFSDFKLKTVYEAISSKKKVMVEKKDIYKMWDGGADELRELAVYNLNDSEALHEVFDTFIPIMVELSKTTYNTLSDVCVSTTGQLVEFMLMRYAHVFGELIPDKPTDGEIRQRLANPIEGAYVKVPSPGIYSNLAILDFRGLYPSIIISHNIDPSSINPSASDYYESPIGTRFDKSRKSIMPTILKQLIDQRAVVKKLYKKDPDNVNLASRSQALKIVANSFYGYLGYARSRWYSRECAASVTAYGRQYIKMAMDNATTAGFEVIYGDTDSLVILIGSKAKSDVLDFMSRFNKMLPESMELELEDFYTRGVFVGKKTAREQSGAKKKYALISESGRIKIKGFELVRRDWSNIARETQRRVLETILKEGSIDKAVAIVKETVQKLNEGKVPISELAISTQLRKGIDAYDAKSPELAAAQKAIRNGLKTREEVEHAVISYVITKHGSSISDKAELSEFAQDYDASYYINHQIIPATMRILKELNMSEEELAGAGKQKKL